MAQPFDLVVVGDVNADLVLTGDVTPVFGQVEKLLDDASLLIGGSATIFACGAARLGLRVAFVGKVGDDVFGRFMVEALEQRGIDTGGIVRDPVVKTGLTVILSRGQDRAMLTYAGTIGALRYDEIDLGILDRARHVHMGSYFLLEQLLPDVPRLFAEAQRRGLTVSLDTNYDPAERWASGIEETLQHVDIFLPNETELMRITGTRSWREGLTRAAQTVPAVVAKLGGEGAAVQQGEKVVHQPVLPVQVVDTVGAGDSFDAGFVYGHLAGWPLERTLALAMACGACSTRAAGGTAAQPSLEEALRFYGPR
jgi:sugar/nucleoside kinase (ribokinase family)